MRRARVLGLILVVILLTATVGPMSATAQDEKNILLYSGQQDIENIDPAVGENYSINAAHRSLYDALFIFRGNDMEPNLVESYDINDDATVFTFKLKENAVFHDGSPVNADAIVYSWKRLIEIQGPPTYRWAGIADADAAVALDEYTI